MTARPPDHPSPSDPSPEGRGKGYGARGATVRMANRKRTIAAIHVLAGQLGMDTKDANPESEYRSMLWTVARTRSAADLDYTGLERVRAHLAQIAKARGVDNGRKPFHVEPDPAWDWVNKAAPDRRPMLWKIRRLLLNAGRAREYADGIAAAMFRIERLEMCDAWNLHAIITALTKDAKRHASRNPHAS